MGYNHQIEVMLNILALNSNAWSNSLSDQYFEYIHTYRYSPNSDLLRTPDLTPRPGLPTRRCGSGPQIFLKLESGAGLGPSLIHFVDQGWTVSC